NSPCSVGNFTTSRRSTSFSRVCRPIGVICEIMSDDGSMARLPELTRFARTHRLKICTIADLIRYRRTREKLVERLEVVKLPTEHGEFDLYLYRSKTDGQHHLAL